jgi:hypothetical protein
MPCLGLLGTRFFHNTSQPPKVTFNNLVLLFNSLKTIGLFVSSANLTASTTMTIHAIFPPEKYGIVIRKGG